MASPRNESKQLPRPERLPQLISMAEQAAPAMKARRAPRPTSIRPTAPSAR
jgi:hypothetical protein